MNSYYKNCKVPTGVTTADAGNIQQKYHHHHHYQHQQEGTPIPNDCNNRTCCNSSNIHEETVRRQLRESNQELRELEMKLRAAYIGKSLKYQIAEKHAQHLENEKKKLQEQNEQIKTRLADENYYKEQKLTDRTLKLNLRHALQEQINNKNLDKQYLYTEFLKEKKYLDDIVQQIHDEQIEETKEKIAKKEQFCTAINDFIKTKQLWAQQEQKLIEAENQRIIKYLQEHDEKLELYKKLREEKQKSSDELNEKMCAELYGVQQKAREREDLLITLKCEEMKEMAELKRRKELEENFRIRLETRLLLDQQKAEMQLKRLQEKEDEHEFHKKHMQLLAEKDKIEQLTNERKRIKIVEHRKSVQELIKEKQLQRQSKIFDLIKSREDICNEEKRMQQLIEEERIQLIKEHAKHLIGHFPRGILRENDKQYI